MTEMPRMNIQSALVLSILEQWRSYTWTLQGFGFIRTKLANVGRIHVWDSSLATRYVSTMHTHPWPLHSTIISGELINQRFKRTELDTGLPYMHSRIATGEGGGLIGEPEEVRLIAMVPETYWPGEVYEQEPDEIHRSIPQDGCVTLIERPQGPPLEQASVYWPRGSQWISAEPKPADLYQVDRVIQRALCIWNPAQ
jgi:hypothetical protein